MTRRNDVMRFKNFEIRKCSFIGEPPTSDYHKWNFDVVKWADDNSHCWSIGRLEWNRKEPCFEFRSIGTRYLQYREDGLEEWLLKWCEMQEVGYRYMEEEDENRCY
jgi:hypothetical protein